ncbi:MAG: chromosome segregation protein SMC [Chitinispirillia bacterium]|nr:chromosome segregation protein SMC [Chitinispirillia bacterium]MCL2241262.1 chromosome segregation protein SMC [Chitinispirillia bacterium]
MILRKLSIFGFKSFADKTELTFGEGMTAVIGPNGCGKSNVVDAIRWVFGEQRASMLRSANMQEVIFSGTQKRQPLNMAEVTLVIENNKKILPVEYGEVAITRRIYRSGESEYRLNKVPCRLRDIQGIFLDTGVGSSAYTTIENRMIEKILSDKAEERRILFEEAAGIGKYKQMRKESSSKLDKTRQDLLRINDKVAETDRHVKMLARHVEKARKYKSYFDALKSLEIAFENKKYIALTEELKKRRTFLEETEAQRELLKASIATAESRIEKMHIDALDKERELEAAARRVAEAGEKIVSIDKDASVAAERLKNVRANIGRLDDEAAELDRRVEEWSQLKAQIEKMLIEREAQLQKSSERTAGAGGELARFDEQLTAKRRAADQLGRDQIDLVNQIGEARTGHNAATAALNGAFENKDRCEREIHSLESRFEELSNAVEACRTQLARETDANSNLSQSRETLLGRIEREEERYRDLVEKEKHLEAQIASNKSQLKFLEGLNAAFEGYEAGVKALLTANLPGLRGIVADLIHVNDDALLPLVEKLAGEAIQTVVFDTDAQMGAAIEFLKNEKAGAARIVSLERLRQFASSQPAVNSGEGLRDVRTLIRTGDDCAALADHLFGNFVIANDYWAALNAARRLGTNGAAISLADGIICAGDGSVIAGESKKETAGILQRKAQTEKLTADIGRFEQDHNAILTEKDNCTITRDEAKYALVEVNEKINRSQRQQQEQQTTIRHYENEMQNISQRVQALSPEIDRMTNRIREQQDAIASIEAGVAALSSRRDALDEQAEAARADVQAMEAERVKLADHLRNVELETLGLSNRINNDKRDIEQLTKDISQSSAVKQMRIEDKGKCLAEIAELEAYGEMTVKELEDARAKRTELEGVRDLVREDYNGRLLEIEELRKEVKTLNSEQEQAGNLAHDAALKQERDEQERRHGRERMWETYEIDLEGMDQEGLAVLEEDNETVAKEVAMYKERIKHVGQVNMAALEDYDTESARLKEFTDQRDDLQKAVDELEKAIMKLDKEARVQFISTFEQVQKNFTEMFTTLFEGGEASLSLQEGVDPLEAEIHINVRPAGKKMRGVQLLSGGERALTAISLLFALYLVKPSAYCILDELDAPLDDANISRFVRVLRKFAEKTQFIVITHNKRTMEAADLLYGVTQQESGVSTIVSVKFDDAALKAA